MKKIYKQIALTFLGLAALLSCETKLDINSDPDLLTPKAIPMSAELPAAQTGIAASANTYFAIPGGFWSQFWTQSAVANQYNIVDDYSITNNSALITDGWTTMYDALTDIRNIKSNALVDENWNYFLIASTLEVYASQLLVDFYGSIPYSEANNPEILNPSFQSGPEVYDLMVADLKNALSKDLSLSPIDNAPGNTDLIFGGDMNSWTSFANTLLLRLYIRQSKARPDIAQSGINALYNSGASFLESSAAITQFTDEDSRSNPLYENERRQLNVGTNLRASSTLGTFLNANADTRLEFIYDGTSFQEQGDFEDGSPTSSVIVINATDPFYFISLAESKFLQSEARIRYFNGSDAQELYDDGVKAAFMQFDLDGSAFLTGTYAYPNGTLEENIKAVITQKWVSFFPGSGFESFIEQNRTGYPAISSVPTTDDSYQIGELTYAVEANTNGLFPRRFLYPLDERQTNSNAPENIPLTENVWYAN